MIPIGYAHLVQRLSLQVKPLPRPALVSSSANRRIESPDRLLFPKGVAIDDSLAGHLEFADQYALEGRDDLAQVERQRVRETLDRALARKEKDASLLNGLAWSCATRDMYLEQARLAAERAVALEPKNVDILDTLAEVYFRSGDAAKAIEVETRASKLDPKNQYLKDQIERFRRGPTTSR